MKFFVRKQNAPKIDPRSEKFVAAVSEILNAHGIKDSVEQAKCSLALFQEGIKFAQGLKRANGRNTDAVIETHGIKMAAILKQYGITDETEQETMIMEFFAILLKMGGT